MGGYGSTRWNSHSRRYTVEDGIVLRMKTIHSSLIHEWSGTLTWSQNDKKIASIGYQVLVDDGMPSAIRLYYSWNAKDINYFVRLKSTPLPWGGIRYWFTCPNSACGRRVTNLYMPPGSPYFACRICHHLTYKSCQEKGRFDNVLWSLAASMQDVYPGITDKDIAALLDDRHTDHMKQILLRKYLADVEDLPDPYGEYLTPEELCKRSGLLLDDISRLAQIRLLLPDHNGKFRPGLARWARKLAYLLEQGWQLDEMKRWAGGRFKTDNPKQWPPQRSDWQM